MSEDIELYSQDRQALCWELDQLPGLIGKEFPRAFWELRPSQTVDPHATLLVCDTSIQIQVQILDSRSRGWQRIPTELTSIHQRYSDVNAAGLVAPTFDGFVAMKALSWFERREELVHQTRLEISERECLKRLLEWWQAESGEE